MVFDIVFYWAFAFMINRLETSFADYKRNLKNAIKAESFSPIRYYQRSLLKEKLIKVATIAVFHIPFAIFYQIFGLSLTETTGFEQFYILDAGFYGVAGSSIIGFLMASVITAVIYFAIDVIGFAVECYVQKKEIASLHGQN